MTVKVSEKVTEKVGEFFPSRLITFPKIVDNFSFVD
jgi:hypothetical protein